MLRGLLTLDNAVNGRRARADYQPMRIYTLVTSGYERTRVADRRDRAPALSRSRTTSVSQEKINLTDFGAVSGLAVWRNRPIRYLILCGVALIAAIVVGTAIMANNLRDRALFDSERELKNTALIIAEQIDRSFQAVDLVQSSVIEKIQALGITSSEDYARRMSGQDVHMMLKASTSGVVQVYAISLINSDGHLINFSRFWPGPELSVADRLFFKAIKSDPRMTSYVSKSAHNRTDGAWSVFLARRVTARRR